MTHIQTGAERDRGEPGRAHVEATHDKVQRLVADAKAGIAQARANVEHLNRTGRWPS
ncbi:hypothetical protein ACFZAR_05530 [Streptomyces sp. NPDC008222]|uniref:hypothetical protein n=1 Tax=Streptomyces sp. NPDC008222 TaxID=3364820 RepID=UPI0036E9CAD8